jgi:large subunit ribosomal protein L7/L12
MTDLISKAEAEIEALKKKLQEAKARKAKIEARQKAVESKKKRADETRRKILAGALVLELMEEKEETKRRFMEQLDKFLTRDDDRALFGLYPKGQETITTGD